MTAVQANGITIEYDTWGSPDNAAMQHLADAGFSVIAYDNRVDHGWSELGEMRVG